MRRTRYSVMDEMMASPTQPLSVEKRTHHLTRMYLALRAVEVEQQPTEADWILLADAIDMMTTLVHELKVCEDKEGLLSDAHTALLRAEQRYALTGSIRLDGEGIVSLRSILDDYACLIEALPERVMVRCHRLTEKRLGKKGNK